MQTQFVLIILSLSFIKGTCSGQSISNEVLRGRRTQALGQRAIALTQPQPLARPKQAGKLGEGGKPGQGGGGGSAAQKAREALNKAALQQAQAMRKARAAGQRPGQKPPEVINELPPGIEAIKEEYRPRLAAKKILENNRVGMSPEFRDAITAYLRIIAERGRKKNPSPQKKK